VSRKCSIHRVLTVASLATFLYGCQGYLAFSTATRFGLDISQQADRSPNVLLGYKRGELASIPAPEKSASTTEDTYSVLGTFCVWYDPNPFSSDSLQIRQYFATGLAAREAAKNPDMQVIFGHAAFKLLKKEETNQKCF